LLTSQETAFSKQLETIVKEMKKELNLLTEATGDELDKNYKMVVSIMEKARKKVDLVFDQFLTKLSRGFLQLQTEFKQIAQNYRRFDEQKESRREFVREERYGFLWLKKRDIYETRTYTYANVHQTIDQIADFAIEIERGL
jgi:uncharacterized protein (DUF3084 family)